MPYSSNDQLPDSVKNNLPSAAQTVFRNVFNSAKGDEESKIRQAWSAVKNGWKKGKGGKWMKKAMDSFEWEVDIVKSDVSQQLIFGWSNKTMEKGQLIEDSDGDVIKSEELEKAIYDFVLKYRNAGEMHLITEGVGQIVESWVCTMEKCRAMGIEYPGVDGHWVGFKLSKEAHDKVVKGQYRSLSIGGKARRKEIKENE